MQQQCFNILFSCSAMTHGGFAESFPNSLFYFRINRAFYQIESFGVGNIVIVTGMMGRQLHWYKFFQTCNTEHSAQVMLMRGKRRGAVTGTIPSYTCTDPLFHIWGFSQAGDPNSCGFTCPALAGNGCPGPLQQRRRLRTEAV